VRSTAGASYWFYEFAWKSQFDAQRCLSQQKASDYWETSLTNCAGDARQLWARINRAKPPSTARFPHKNVTWHSTSGPKVSKIRVSTASARPPTVAVRESPVLSSFAAITREEIHRLVLAVPCKTCELDPMPTWLVKRSVDLLAPVIADIGNASLQSGYFQRHRNKPGCLPAWRSHHWTQTTLTRFVPFPIWRSCRRQLRARPYVSSCVMPITTCRHRDSQRIADSIPHNRRCWPSTTTLCRPLTPVMLWRWRCSTLALLSTQLTTPYCCWRCSPGSEFTDDLRKILRQFSDLRQPYDNWRIHRTFMTILRPILRQNITITLYMS